MRSPDANGTQDDAYLDRLFGRLLEAVRDGTEVDVDAEIAAHPQLERDIRELVELAQRTAVRKAPLLPKIAVGATLLICTLTVSVINDDCALVTVAVFVAVRGPSSVATLYV